MDKWRLDQTLNPKTHTKESAKTIASPPKFSSFSIFTFGGPLEILDPTTSHQLGQQTNHELYILLPSLPLVFGLECSIKK